MDGVRDAGAPSSSRAAATGSAPVPATPSAPRPAPTGPATTASTSATAAPPPGRVLLFPRSGGDGDSWRDRAGVQYRLGLVNAPELDECFGREASAERQRLTAAGFRAQVYATDRFGRGVSVVTLADGRELNTLLARQGWVDDRYLEQFREENGGLASRLDAAFAAARRERVGLWGACAGSAAPVPLVPPTPAPPAPVAGRDGCEAAYPTVCVPPGPDLDCRDLTARRFPVRPPDPHRLDGNGDGVGCEGPR